MYFITRCFLVTNAAAATRLTTIDIKTPSVLIQAERSNTGYVYIGDSALSTTNYGSDLASGDSVSYKAPELGMASTGISLKDIWHLSSQTGDGVSVTYLERVE